MSLSSLELLEATTGASFRVDSINECDGLFSPHGQLSNGTKRNYCPTTFSPDGVGTLVAVSNFVKSDI